MTRFICSSFKITMLNSYLYAIPLNHCIAQLSKIYKESKWVRSGAKCELGGLL